MAIFLVIAQPSQTYRSEAVQERTLEFKVDQMPKQFSIAEAKNKLPSIVHEVEDGLRVDLTRYGRPVAVLLSVQEYERMANAGADFWDKLTGIRKKIHAEKIVITGDEFDHQRDSSSGREFHW